MTFPSTEGCLFFRDVVSLFGFDGGGCVHEFGYRHKFVWPVESILTGAAEAGDRRGDIQAGGFGGGGSSDFCLVETI